MTAFAVTGIGSLGHGGAERAVSEVFALELDLPFWPQLPRLGAGESMVVQGASALGMLEPVDVRGTFWRPVGASPSRRAAAATAVERGDSRGFEPHAAGYDAFLAALETRSAPHVKGQWIGPATLLAAVALDHAVALGDEPDIAAQALDALHLNLVAQARALGAHAPQVDLWLDEPLFATVHRSRTFDVAAARAWYARLGAACGPRVRLGVHDCAGIDSALFELGVPVLSIDVSETRRVAGDAQLRRHLERGFVAWGIARTGAECALDVEAMCAAVGEIVAATGMAEAELGARSILTPACGLAGLEPEAGMARLAVLVETARRLRGRIA